MHDRHTGRSSLPSQSAFIRSPKIPPIGIPALPPTAVRLCFGSGAWGPGGRPRGAAGRRMAGAVGAVLGGWGPRPKGVLSSSSESGERGESALEGGEGGRERVSGKRELQYIRDQVRNESV